MRVPHVIASSLLPLLAAATAQAQVFTPTYTSPRLINEIGVHVSDGPGNLALEGIWRADILGLRVGYVDAANGLLSVGGELRAPLAAGNAEIGLAFTIGAQGLFGDSDAAGVQVGASAGHTFMGSGAAFTPYLHPRVGMVQPLASSDWGFEVMADVGLDVEFWTNVVARLGVNIGGPGASWGVGLAWRR